MPTYASQLTDTQNYDSLGRLMTRKSSITGAASTVPVLSSGYEYDSNNRRRALALSDGSSWAYDYDAKGEVISGKRTGSAGTPAIGAIYTSPTSPTIQHDFDGNLTSDGLWTYAWDGENRLKSMYMSGLNGGASGPPRLKVDFVYDGNGNVMGTKDASSLTWSSQYEYGPFGEVIRSSGTMAKSNPFRFSTKYQDDESELLYYGYRFYNAATGRWLNRDPKDELGFSRLGSRNRGNLKKRPTTSTSERHYAFVGNQPISQIDALGLCPAGSWNMGYGQSLDRFDEATENYIKTSNVKTRHSGDCMTCDFYQIQEKCSTPIWVEGATMTEICMDSAGNTKESPLSGFEPSIVNRRGDTICTVVSFEFKSTGPCDQPPMMASN